MGNYTTALHTPQYVVCILVAALEEKLHVYSFLVGLWLMICLIIGTSYKGNLMSKLIAPKVDIPFRNYEELVMQTKIPYFVVGGTFLYNFGSVSTVFTITILGLELAA